MKKSDIRGAISQAELNAGSAKVLYGEIVILSLGLGLFTQSFLVFIIVLFVSMIMISFKSFGRILCVFFSLFWGAIGFLIGTLESTIMAIVLALIAFILSLGVHMSAIQYVDDISSDEE